MAEKTCIRCNKPSDLLYSPLCGGCFELETHESEKRRTWEMAWIIIGICVGTTVLPTLLWAIRQWLR